MNLKNAYMKKSLISALAFFLAFSAAAQLRVSVLGDSYSTFEGFIPEGNEVWYSANTNGNDVNSPEQTWWSIMADRNGLIIDRNESYSGATVCFTGYRGEDYRDRSFNTRADRLGNPEVIFVFGGTNDDWAKSPLGDYKYGDWTDKDMYSYRPAFAALLSRLKNLYPDALVVNICNSDLRKDITESMDEICRHYDVPNIRLKLIDKQRNHPSKSGMLQIADQVWRQSAPLIYTHLKKK